MNNPISILLSQPVTLLMPTTNSFWNSDAIKIVGGGLIGLMGPALLSFWSFRRNDRDKKMETLEYLSGLVTHFSDLVNDYVQSRCNFNYYQRSNEINSGKDPIIYNSLTDELKKLDQKKWEIIKIKSDLFKACVKFRTVFGHDAIYENRFNEFQNVDALYPDSFFDYSNKSVEELTKFHDNKLSSIASNERQRELVNSLLVHIYGLIDKHHK